MFANQAHAVRETEPVSLYVREHANLHLMGHQSGDVLRGAEALALARKLLEDVVFVVEVAHKSNYVRLLYTCEGVILAEHPARMRLQLAVAVADELEKQTAHFQPVLNNVVNEAQKEIVAVFVD